MELSMLYRGPALRQPPESGSEYYNYKHFFSVLLLALVDASYKFLYVNVGAPGRAGDAGVYSECTFHNELANNRLNLPPPVQVQGMTEKLPFHLIGDDAFPLSKQLMEPYPQRNLDHPKRIFNYRFSRARRVVENAFGILANRWRIFLTTIQHSPEKVVYLIIAACTLHNMLVETNKAYYSSSADSEGIHAGVIQGAWRNDPALIRFNPAGQGRNGSQESKMQRAHLTSYFLGAGSVPGQENMITLSH